MSSNGDKSQSAMTLYLVYLVFIATVGPLQFGYHLVRASAYSYAN